MKSMMGLRIEGTYLFPICRPTSGTWLTSSQGLTLILRGSAYRSDSVTPLGPNKVLIEFRGYGLRKDTPEERQTRIKHHNIYLGTVWS